MLKEAHARHRQDRHTPDSILLKLDKLDGREWEIMKSHTTIGAEILAGSSVDMVKMGRVIALTHHEKWDGSGYPQGLKGRKTPLIGRIVAIADVFGALTSKRPYKEAFSVEKSNRIISEGREAILIRRLWTPFFQSKTRSSKSRRSTGIKRINTSGCGWHQIFVERPSDAIRPWQRIRSKRWKK
jgi:putative two-component system response regulator